MHRFEIEPLIGIGPIRLGMEATEVRDALAAFWNLPMQPRTPNCDTYFDAALQVNYDNERRVEFIETAKHPAFRVIFNGHALHELPAETVVEVVSAVAPGYWEEQSHTYIVPSLQLSFWRAVTPEHAQSRNDDRGMYFEAIGAGRSGYF